MDTPPKDLVEVVFNSDQSQPVRLWVQTTPNFAKRFAWNKEQSVKILGGAAVALLILLLFFRGLTVMLALAGLMVLFPLKLVGMAGYSRDA